ncbi:hypothetical protein OIO90_000923 [Microbotryomycetes sp. JL221]|nr:hypothetical protein OIO90_000923 [Microbotryomycetes sp. JL221]
MQALASPAYDAPYDSTLHPQSFESRTVDYVTREKPTFEMENMTKNEKKSIPKAIAIRLQEELSSIEGLESVVETTLALVDATRDTISELARLRQQFAPEAKFQRHHTSRSGLSAPRNSRGSRLMSPEAQDRMISLAEKLSNDILLAYETIQQLRLEFPDLTQTVSDLKSSHGRVKAARKKVNKLYDTFALVLDMIEDRAEEERNERDQGHCVERLDIYIAETRPQLSKQQRNDLVIEARRLASMMPAAELGPISLARRWALENIFTQVEKILAEIDRRETEFARKISLIKASDLTKKRSLMHERLYDLGKGHRRTTTGDSSDSGASLLADGELPYVVIIVTMYVYWGVSRSLGKEHPLGRVQLGSFLGDKSWSDKHEGQIDDVAKDLSSVAVDTSSSQTVAPPGLKWAGHNLDEPAEAVDGHQEHKNPFEAVQAASIKARSPVVVGNVAVLVGMS